MSDDQPPGSHPSEDEETPDAITARTSRRTAQGAAGDLARMGIDPRSLGLDDDSGPVSRRDAGVEVSARVEDPTAQIVPLRPEFATPPEEQEGPARATTPTPTPRAAQVGPPRGPVEDMIARTAALGRPPRKPSRLLRAVTLGLLTPDAAEAAGAERDLVASLRHRQTERRIVTFVSGKGGVGTTTVLCGVGSAFAALRDDRTALIDVQPGTPALSALNAVSEPHPARSLLKSDRAVEPSSSSSGLDVVDGVGWDQPLQRRDVSAILDRLGGEHAFNLIDAGNDPGEGSHAALARCDQAVVVTGVGVNGVRALEVAVARVRQVNPGAAERAVYVVVCQNDESYRRAYREVTSRLSVAPARVVVVPPDEVLRSGGVFDASRVSPATREAMIEVGAALALTGGGR